MAAEQPLDLIAGMFQPPTPKHALGREVTLIRCPRCGSRIQATMCYDVDLASFNVGPSTGDEPEPVVEQDVARPSQAGRRRRPA